MDKTIAKNHIDISEQLWFIDWKMVPVDTPVLVSMDAEKWQRSYFAKYRDKNRCRYGVFVHGKTKWSSSGKISYWEYCKIAEE